MNDCRFPADADEKKYLEPYREAVERFGPGFLATLWSSRDSQQLRFDVMINLAGFEGCTVLDAGCGPGDFAAYLLKHNVGFSRYVGIDAMPEMIAEATRRELPRCEFRVADLVHDQQPLHEAQPDWVCISGMLNTMDEVTARQVVSAAYHAATQGVIFNFLSDRTHTRWTRYRTGPARRFNTVNWLEWSLDLTSRVTFTQDYLDGHDATIMLRHDEE